MKHLASKKVKQSPLKRQVRNAVILVHDFCLNYQGDRKLSFVTKNLLRQQPINALTLAAQEISAGKFPILLLRLLHQRRIGLLIKRDTHTKYSLKTA